MIFSDPSFLFAVLPVTMLLFYGLTARLGTTWGLGVLFISSVIIYLRWGERNVAILLSSVAANFVALCIIVPDNGQPGARVSALYLGLAYNLLTLIWFKYNFVRVWLTSDTAPVLADIGIPIGISFYTFQQASVLVDAYNREPSVARFVGDLRTIASKLRGFVRYGFFVTFFPHMIIGPIAYMHEIEPQIAGARFGKFRAIDVSVGLMLIGFGLFKKLVLADNLAQFADPVFAQAAQGGSIDPVSGWLGILAYYTQLYFDFSGYSDMALGLARLFGVTFPINFFSPLKAVGIVDFYRRWHMTLTRVISRFLFSPLSLAGTRYAARHHWRKTPAKMIRLWLPLFLNFEVIGLWHGATWTFVLFGAVHGAWYVIETEVRTTRTWKSWKKYSSPKLRRAIGRVGFLVPMALTFAIFRSSSLEAFRHLLLAVTWPDASLPRITPTLEAAAWVGVGLAIIHLLPNSIELMRRYRPGILTYENEQYGFDVRWRPDWRWAAI